MPPTRMKPALACLHGAPNECVAQHDRRVCVRAVTLKHWLPELSREGVPVRYERVSCAALSLQVSARNHTNHNSQAQDVERPHQDATTAALRLAEERQLEKRIPTPGLRVRCARGLEQQAEACPGRQHQGHARDGDVCASEESGPPARREPCKAPRLSRRLLCGATSPGGATHGRC